MTARARAAALVAAVALLATGAPAAADELRILERHEVWGRRGGEAFRGWVEVAPDATYRGRLTFASGREVEVAGRARIEEDDLVLDPAGGDRLVFERADADRRVRWRWAAGDDAWTLEQPGRTESPLGTVLRLARRGEDALEWLTERNLGVVDHAPEGRILRSRQPTPAFVDRLVRLEDLQTVLSLNGDQDDVVPYVPDPRFAPDGLRGDLRPREVNLQAHIREVHGLRHDVFGLSASRAPTDAELVEIFRALLDDDLKPILLHCRGGADRTGIVAALYEVEFLGETKAAAKARMRAHMWAASGGTEIQGAYLDLYQRGTIRGLLREAGVEIPPRYRADRRSLRRAY